MFKKKQKQLTNSTTTTVNEPQNTSYEENCFGVLKDFKTPMDIWKFINGLFIKKTNVAEEKFLLAACVAYIMEECNPEDRNFESIIILLKNGYYEHEGVDSILTILFENLYKKNPNSMAVLYYEIFRKAVNGCDNEFILPTIEMLLPYMEYDSAYADVKRSESLMIDDLLDLLVPEEPYIPPLVFETEREQSFNCVPKESYTPFILEEDDNSVENSEELKEVQKLLEEKWNSAKTTLDSQTGYIHDILNRLDYLVDKHDIDDYYTNGRLKLTKEDKLTLIKNDLHLELFLRDNDIDVVCTVLNRYEDKGIDLTEEDKIYLLELKDEKVAV